ncbi:peptidase inhibitor family I36 protein [Glycomyces tritici]|uniref:Peptidase inhibitor family I36 protein n=1 Tax=Glycomyces tritici TaxID=2665176 RepID=A0ABT7YX05_9ACTN|nr:peptidase inhibitor family I36 protein [Glycomyces tritici]MDN3243162.1 peptidase inhibitor family I36 protein [Glycomyces tritici]
MSRKFRAALTAAGAAVLMATGFTAGTASAAPADAPEAWDDCAKGHVCMWSKPDFSGEKLVDWNPRHAGGALYNLSASTEYRASSIRNNSNFPVRLANQRDGTGIGLFLVCAHTSRRDLYGFDNATKSIVTLHQCRPPVEPE